MMGAVVALVDKAIWRGKIYSGGWVTGAGGDAAVIEPATGDEIGRAGLATPADANLEAFTDTRWVTIRGDIKPYPF
jgi:hypothetical protein